MCMICRGLQTGKLSVKEATEKYEDMLDLIDEDHQEEIEELLAEQQDEQDYWDDATRDYFKMENDDYMDEEEAIEESLTEVFDDEESDE